MDSGRPVIKVVRCESHLREALDFLLTGCDQTVGFSVESSFESYSKNDGRFVSEKVAVLTLCSQRYCAIIHLARFSCATPIESLAKFLNLTSFTFVGKNIDRDAADLYRDYGIRVRNTINLEDYLKGRTYRDCLLAELQRDLIETSREIAFCDWESSDLSDGQIRYACANACGAVHVAANLGLL